MSDSFRAGVVDLRDLADRYAWDELAIARFVAATALTPGGAPETRFAPPPVVVAIVPYDREALVAQSRVWLEDATHVVIVRTHEDPVDDPEICALIDAEWTALLARFDVAVEVADWRSDDDLAGPIARAVELAARTAAREAPAARAIVEHPPSRRFAIAPVTPRWLDLETVLATQLMSAPEGPVLHTGDGRIDLADPPAQVARLALGEHFCAATPDGRILSIAGRERWRLDDEIFDAPGFWPLGFDGHQPVGWTGLRMTTYWLYVGRRGVGHLSATDHDYPCGPAKKLYGYEDNDPLRVHLAPDRSAASFHFGHDVMITTAVPIRWRSAGALDVADFPRDPSRAVFFIHEDEGACTDDLLDEDARDAAPALVLGPSPAARYAVDLQQPVYRLTAPAPNRGAVAPVGGPAAAFAVFDQDHREVRRARGRLLGGWWRHATVVDDGAYWREDLGTGARRWLAPVDGTIVCVVPVPWTANVVVVAELDGRTWAALV